jgi:hypothetical protein
MTKISDDIIKQIQEEIYSRGRSVDSLDELNKIAGEVTDRYNRTAHPDFEGLSPAQMHCILDFPFSPNCPVRFKTGTMSGTLTDSPILKACITILNAVHTVKGLKLTQKGNLPRKVVSDIFNLDLFAGDTDMLYPDKVRNEHDYVPAAMANALLKVAGITRLQYNKMHITKNGKKVSGDKALLFQALFTAFATRYNKGFLDYYGETEIGNLGMLYVVYLLLKYGSEKRNAEFYAKLYFRAFPTLIREVRPYTFTSQEQTAIDCFILRVFNRGLFLFGLIEKENTGEKYFNREYLIKTSVLFHKVFELK